MWLLITFIIIWVLSPGPVAIMTLHESRKNGLMAGVAVSGGATVAGILMVFAALLLHFAGISAILESTDMMIIERIGALALVGLGIYMGYKSLWATGQETAVVEKSGKFGFAQGMMAMAAGIPQTLIFYNLIIPQTVAPQAVVATILAIGIFEAVMIFGWHSGIAFVATRAQGWLNNSRVTKGLEASTAVLIMGLGLNILF